MSSHMVTLRTLVDFGWALMFGVAPSSPVTTRAPAGDPVMAGTNRNVEAWQREAWRMWKQVGELHYPTTRLSRQASQLSWRVRVNGRELSADSAKREMEIVTAGIGPAEATYLLKLNLQVAGEAWYVETEPESFAVWSVLEEDLDKKLERLRAQRRIVLRIWQPDPTNTERADSSVRTALGPAEELVILESLSRAQARSRIAQAGILVTPAEQLYSGADPWEQDLLEAMSSAIKDERHPSAMVPIHIRMRRDLIESIRYITFPRPYDDLIDRKQERAIRRVAQALDIEPELLLGLGESTYWNAWAVSIDTYQAHIAPRVTQIGLLYAEVSERLRQREGQTAVIEVEPDPRVMLARRSTVRDALDALRNGAVGFAFLRDAIGATDADAPTPEELDLILALAGRSMDRERRVGENPGPARSSPENSTADRTDFDVILHARKALGFKLRAAWRNTPQRNRLSGIDAPDYTAWVPLSDISREMPISEVLADAIAEVALPDDRERLLAAALDTLTRPMSALLAKEVV
jgi:hypothetical protein